MGRTKDSFGLEILILLFLTLCTPSNSAELVLRPVGSEYQPISTNSEGECCAKRQFTCVPVTTNSLLHLLFG